MRRRQHLPIAQQRRLLVGRAASLPWVQHWQVWASLLIHVWTSRLEPGEVLVPRPG